MGSIVLKQRLLAWITAIGMALLACDRESENPRLVEQPAFQDSEDTESVDHNASCEQSVCATEIKQMTAKTCHSDGVDYQLGEKMPSIDSCNDCVCGEQGMSCAQLACEDEPMSQDELVEEPSICDRCLAGEDLEICRQIRCAMPKE